MNIENKKQLAVLLLAAGLGLLATFLLSQYVQNDIKAKTEEISQKYERQAEKQRQEMAQAVQYMQQDFNTKLAQLAKQQEAQQQQLAQAQQQAIELARQQQQKRQEDPKPASQAFSVLTPPGKRAVTIRIDTLNAVGGLIKSGDRVDIIARLTIPDQGDDPSAPPKQVTTMLFQDIQVLAVNTKFLTPITQLLYDAQQSSRTLNVTLALDPQEAPLLSFVQEHGEIKMSLRSPTESGTKIVDVASWDSLADYLLEEHGTNLMIPVTNLERIEPEEAPDLPPVRRIQVFKSGLETSL